jgi:hypothetical protein
MRPAAALLLLGALVAAGCADGPSLVVVDVTADAPLDGVATLAVQATTGGHTASFTIDAPGGSLSVNPATQTFGIQVPKGTTGSISVIVDAKDGDGNVLASGSGSGTIKTSGRSDVNVELAVSGATPPDMSDPSTDMAGGPPGDMALPSTAAMLAGDRATQMFGSVTVGKSSNAVMIKVTNGGDMPTGTPTFTPSGTNLAEFTLTNGCTAALMPNASCYVTAQFAPTTMGAKTAHFDVAATPGGTVGVDLSGTGEPPGTLQISADAPSNGDCGSAVVGQTSTTFATYTVTNVGSSTTGTMTVSTGDPQFIASGCTGTLAPNATCSITVHIKPTVGGPITSSVSVKATPGGTAPANVKGTGLNPAAFKITSSTGSFDFGSAARNSAGNVITFTATNTGDVPSATLTASTFGGANASSFLVTNDACKGQAVAPAGTCTVQVELKPLASGTLNATLQINDAAGVRAMANVTGAGTPIWQQEMLPTPMGQMAVPGLSTVFGVAGDGSHIYAAGNGYYYVRDATGAWTPYAIMPAGITPGAMAQGSALGVNSVFLASDAGVLRSTAPASWSAQYEPAGGVDGIVAFSPSDGWAVSDSSGLQLHRLTASGWAADSMITGYGDTTSHRAPLFGTSDSDVWLGGGAVLTVGGTTQSTPLVWHRDASGMWTQQPAVYGGCHFCVGGVSPRVVALWGFGTPTTTLFASTTPVAPAVWSGGTWTALANVPLNMGGSGKTCLGVWGASPTNVWFSCFGGMFLYTGGGNWDDTAQLNVSGFQAVWGSSANDVYAVGTDSNGAGFVYHYF